MTMPLSCRDTFCSASALGSEVMMIFVFVATSATEEQGMPPALFSAVRFAAKTS